MSDTTVAYTCRVAADLASLAELRGELSALLEEQCWPPEVRQRMLLAGGEALANAIEHGSEPSSEVDVAIEVNGATAILSVIDGGRNGGGPLPSFHRTPPPPGAIRGRGMLIMAALSECAEVRRVGAGTEVRLTFARHAAAHDGA
jgi:anti-sigma regulatory factor (Ser/Thr protein kinase)